ncbi:translation initiation factor IF-2 [Candidatus Woesearchaeota archaeon]|nr:translation initiation factor IF-2 [Candidatus Woesearchaeota archaeon]
MKNLRSPICVVVGHIDHGKSSILDRIRNTNIIASEAGGITQAISFTNLGSKRIKEVSGRLLEALKINLTIPGILFLDTPGHAAFNNLRRRGGNLADIAILVIDITKGIEEQSVESINILKQYKTPFIIAANKIDLLSGWQKKDDFLIKDINLQSERVKQELDNKIYELVGKLSGLGFNSERFDRVDDYTKNVAIVPVSAKTNDGISELLMVVSGLAQKYLENNLLINKESGGRGTILEVKEEKAGTVIYSVIYDGTLKKNDQIVIGGVDKPIITKVRAIFSADEKFKFKKEKEVSAAIGIKLLASNVKDVISGMPLVVANKDLDKHKEEVQKEVEEVLIHTDREGIIVKADTLGGLEALTNLLKQSGLQIKKASIGNISKKDIADAMAENEELNKAILGFNVKAIDETNEVKIITNEVIYKLIEDYENWKKQKLEEQEKKELENVIRPCKVQILPGCVFRQSNPAVVGVIVLGGLVKNNTPLIKVTGEKISEVKSMQLEGKNIDKAEKNKEIALSLPSAVVGRHIRERDILISDMNEEDFIKLKKLKKYLNRDEIELLKEIANIKRKKDPLWGI